jgi:hypothetical protein
MCGPKQSRVNFNFRKLLSYLIMTRTKEESYIVGCFKRYIKV